MAPKDGDGFDFASLLNDKKKMAKGQKKAAESTEEWKGPSHKERRDMEAEAKRVMKQKGMQKSEKISWKKKIGTIVMILFMTGAGLFQFISTVYAFMVGNGISYINVKDTPALKTILFSGEPHLVYCVDNQTQNYRLPQFLEDGAARSISSSIGVKTVIVNCWEETESGRSIANRFNMRSQPPLVFLAANGNAPKVVDLTGLKEAEALEKKVKPMLELKTYKIDKLKQWPSLCISRKSCVVVGHKTGDQRKAALDVLTPLQESHRAVKIVTLDTSFWQLKLDETVMKTKVPGQTGAAVLCLAKREGGAEGNATHVGRFLSELDSTIASNFLTMCETQKELVLLNVTPSIRARPTKPKKVKARPPPRPRPRPRPRPAPSPPKKKVGKKQDYVGSRAALENEDEAIFESVTEESEEAGGQAAEAEEEDDEVVGAEEDVEEDAEEESDDDEVEL